MPDDATRLAAEILRLAEEQDAAMAADDWDAFLALAERRGELVDTLAPMVTGRQDLLPLLRQVAAKDQAQQARLQEATDKVRAELSAMRPQQLAMHAYFAGVAVADTHEARFIDSRDAQP